MKRGVPLWSILFVWIALFFCSFSVVSGDELYDEYVYNGDTILAEEIPVNILLTATKAQIKVNNQDSFLLDYGDCEITVWFTLCIGSYIPDSCEDTAPSSLDCRVAASQTEGGVSATILNVESFEAEVTITQSAPDSTLYVGDTGEITTVVENTGTVKINAVEFQESFPSNITLRSSSQGDISFNTLDYGVYALAVGESFEITYSFISDILVESIQKPVVFFEYGGTEFETFGSGVTITYESPLAVTLESEAEVDEESTATITLTNNKDDDIHVKISGQWPEEWDLDGASHLIAWEGNLDNNDEQVFSVDFVSPVSGSFTIPLTYEVDGVLQNEELETSIDALGNATIVFSMLPEMEVLHGRQREIALFAKPSVDITDFDVLITSDLFENSGVFFKTIDEDDLTTILKKLLDIPFVLNETIVDIILEGTYVDGLDDKTRSVEHNYKITIVPEWESIELSNTVNKIGDNQYAIAGILTKSVNTPIPDVHVQHFLDGSTFSKNQVYSRFIDLLDVGPSTETQNKLTALSYEVRMPFGAKPRYASSVLIAGGVPTVSTFEIPAVTKDSYPLSASVTIDPPLNGLYSAQLSLTNSGEEIVTNVEAIARLTPGVDIDRYPTFRLSQLEPGETVDFDFVLRPNVDDIVGDFLFFYDADNGDAYYEILESTFPVEGTGKLVSKSIDVSSHTLNVQTSNSGRAVSAELFLGNTTQIQVPAGISSVNMTMPLADLLEMYVLPLLVKYDDGYYTYAVEGEIITPAVNLTVNSEATNVSDELDTAVELEPEVEQAAATQLEQIKANSDTTAVFIIGLGVIIMVGIGLLVQRYRKMRLGL